MNGKFALRFSLDVEDEWPPAGIEGVLASHAPDGHYRIESPPLFVKGLAAGDVIGVEFDGENDVSGRHHVDRSSRSTIWLLRLVAPSDLERTQVELEGRGCQVVRLPQFGSYSVDVPENLDIEVVDKILANLDESKVAAAYLAFRHPE